MQFGSETPETEPAEAVVLALAISAWAAVAAQLAERPLGIRHVCFDDAKFAQPAPAVGRALKRMPGTQAQGIALHPGHVLGNIALFAIAAHPADVVRAKIRAAGSADANRTLIGRDERHLRTGHQTPPCPCAAWQRA